MSNHNLKLIPPSGYEMVPDGDRKCYGTELLFTSGGWINTNTSKGEELNSGYLYCRPIAKPATPDAPSWPKPFKTSERLPTKEDASRGNVLGFSAGTQSWSTIGWAYVAGNPDSWPRWMHLPPPPEPDHTEAEKAWEVFAAENKIGPSSLINYKQFWIAAYELGKSARNL